jgi:cyclohexa-1,5-dienecarbonyl-CoA hydratase
MPLEIAYNPAGTRAALIFEETPGNVITDDLVRQLRTALEDLATETHLRLVTLEGKGPDFSFGASIPEHLPGRIERVLPEMHALVTDLVSLPIPTAAVVRGRCLGGGFELALACDFIFAETSATFGLPEIAIGVFPPAASVLLPARVGTARATAAILSGASQPAGVWQSWGLIELVAEGGMLARAVDEWFDRTLAPRSAEALRHAVRAVRTSLADAVGRDLPGVERLYLSDLMRSQDAVEGIRAFLEKRPASWQDR